MFQQRLHSRGFIHRNPNTIRGRDEFLNMNAVTANAERSSLILILKKVDETWEDFQNSWRRHTDHETHSKGKEKHTHTHWTKKLSNTHLFSVLQICSCLVKKKVLQKKSSGKFDVVCSVSESCYCGGMSHSAVGTIFIFYFWQHEAESISELVPIN